MATPTLQTVLTAIGITTLLTLAFRLLTFLHLHTRRTSLPRYLHPKNPTWALVTGASDGIGLELAKHLSASGFHILLHGRNPTKLANVKAALQSQYPNTQYELAISDASQPDPTHDAPSAIAATAKSLSGPLTVLINNCGGASNMPRAFNSFVGETTPPQIDGLLNLNARFAIQLTAALMPVLLADAQQPALVLSISSTAGTIGPPFHAVYAGAKACVDLWTTALRRELAIEGRDVEVLSVISGMVSGTTWLRGGGGWFVPDARTFARAALDKVGCGLPVVWGFWSHEFQVAAMGWWPRALADWVINVASNRLRDAETKKL